jgi:hypothetical protein
VGTSTLLGLAWVALRWPRTHGTPRGSRSPAI